MMFNFLQFFLLLIVKHLSMLASFLQEKNYDIDFFLISIICLSIDFCILFLVLIFVNLTILPLGLFSL